MIPDAFEPSRLTFALFHPPQDFGDKITLSSRLRDAAEGLYDGEPLILPVPGGGPADLPRIQLQSRDQSHTLQVSLQRLTVEWVRRSPTPAPWSSVGPGYLGVVDRICRIFIGEYARPTRFSFIPQFLYRMQGSANEYFAARVLHPDRLLQKPATFKLGVHDQLQMHGRVMNLWMNVNTARNQQNPAEDNGAAIQFDFNSLAEDTRPYAPEEIQNILGEIEPLMERRMQALFNDIFWASA